MEMHRCCVFFPPPIVGWLNRFVANQAHAGSLGADGRAGARARTAVLQVSKESAHSADV